MDWKAFISEEEGKAYYKELQNFVNSQYETRTVYPAKADIFRAFTLTEYDEVKVVILGQDPYHGEGQAHGLSFSVASKSAKFPPSLGNIFKELKTDLGIDRTNSNLTDWAEQGVLLLNTVLTVEGGEAASHRGRGWEIFTDAVIERLNQRKDPVVFVLWGNDAQKKAGLITNPIHHIIKSAHPSPLAAFRGFFASRPFSRVNGYLDEIGKPGINW